MEDPTTPTRSSLISQITSSAETDSAISAVSDTIDPNNPLHWIRSNKDRVRRDESRELPALKSLNMKFVHGEYSLRKLLPAHRIPPCLDPKFVNFKSQRELPLCWFGIPLSADKALELAIELDVAIPLEFEENEYDWGLSFYMLQEAFEKDSEGIRFNMVDVWGTRCKEAPLLGFFSNRDLPNVKPDDIRYIHLLLDMMKYPKDYTKRNLRWYPDINETR